MISYSICLSLTYFTLHNALKVHPCCHKWQNFLHHCWIIFHCGMCVCVCVCVCVCQLALLPLFDYWIYISHIFFIHSSLNGHLSCFRILAIVNKPAVSIDMQISLQDPNFISLDIYPEVGFLDHMVVLFSILGRTSILSSIVAIPIYIPTNSAQVFLSLHKLTNTCL